MPTSITSTYFLPAIFLNPVVILHGINTFLSHMIPPTNPVSTSQHQWLECLGPRAGSEPYLNMHKNDQMCWSYTAIMVVIQLVAYGRVRESRGKKRKARAIKAEQEEIANNTHEAVRSKTTSGKTAAAHHDGIRNTTLNDSIDFRNGQISLSDSVVLAPNGDSKKDDGGTSTPEISSEETIV